ncbi:MAG: hypothetical protein MZV70_45125 [Desulfobacterales bacterium]|nr:hypothetical protein [Desulfobacterales bacterium]
MVVEKGPKGTKKYKIEHVLGGKRTSIGFPITSEESAVLLAPAAAYDVNKQARLDTAASGVRHFPGRTA